MDDELVLDRGEGSAMRHHALLDLAHGGLCLFRMAVRDEPARAFRHETPQHHDAEPKQRADGEAQAPADIDGEARGIEQQDRRRRTHGGAEPVAAIDDEVDASAEPRRHQLVDRRIDGGVFAADPGAGQGAEKREAPEIP